MVDLDYGIVLSLSNTLIQQLEYLSFRDLLRGRFRADAEAEGLSLHNHLLPSFGHVRNRLMDLIPRPAR